MHSIYTTNYVDFTSDIPSILRQANAFCNPHQCLAKYIKKDICVYVTPRSIGVGIGTFPTAEVQGDLGRQEVEKILKW